MEILGLCSTLTDIRFLEGDPVPLGLAPFLAQSSRAWWSIVTSLHLIIRKTPKEWLRLKSMLLEFKKLKSLTLEIEFLPPEESSALDECESAGEDAPRMLPSLDSLTIAIAYFEASPGDLALVGEIVSSWPRVKRLSFDVMSSYSTSSS